MPIRSWKYRSYPSKTQQKEMSLHLWLCKELWNEMLTFTKDIYKKYGKFPTKRTLREFVKDSGLYSQVGQELVDRLVEGLQRKMTMKKRGATCGFPRFKSMDSMKSLIYPQSGFKLIGNRKISVSPFGEVNLKKHREVKGKIKTLTIKRESSGKWFAILTSLTSEAVTNRNPGKPVGLDLGLKTFATMSDGNIIGNPRHILKYEAKLRDCQRFLSKKKKGSKNRKRAKRRLAFVHEKLRNTRNDFLHKVSHKLVHLYSFIALEDLASQEMSEKAYGKQINDAGWSKFISCMCYKAESAGCTVQLVNPKNTTNECSRCGALVKKTLRERQHNCLYCGLSIDRDLNAATNILNRATLRTVSHSQSSREQRLTTTDGTPGSNACGDVSIGTSMKQDATKFIQW